MDITPEERLRIQQERNRDIALEHAVNLAKAGVITPIAIWSFAYRMTQWLDDGVITSKWEEIDEAFSC